MASLSDLPVVGKIIDKISDVIVEAGIRGLRYTLCSKNLVNQLKSDIHKVETPEGHLSRKVGEARNDGKIILREVEEWQTEVQSKKTVADELSRQPTSYTCFNVFTFPNLVSRFRLGRKAAHLSKDVSDLTASGMTLMANEVGYVRPVDNLLTSNSTYQSFPSREEAYGKLWEALLDHNGDPILAIYGMPGVGKTLMMEKACKDARDQKIFDKVARINVSGEELNVIKLQDKLAASLDCHLESKDNEQQRASQLETSLMNGGKTLVILDDVWEFIPLHDVGIPSGDSISKGCKILFTSRKQDVCLDNNCTYPIEIKTLTDGEAWVMFQNAVGSSKIETLTDASLAEKVCKKCAALPLVINAVASALKSVPESLWSQSLHQLESHRFEEIKGINGQVYACLAFSFERLNVIQRRCLFLCSFFQEDEDIAIDMLFKLATGSQVLVDRRDINAVIDILQLSSLLLRGDDDTVKLHDIIREVARSKARGDPEYAFLSVRCNSWFPDNNLHAPYPRLLQLELEDDDVCCPDDSVFPYVGTLWLRGNRKRKQLSTDFFKRFMNLEFLVLEGISFPDQQPMSIHRLEKLRAVVLNGCDIPQAFVSSISKYLQILCIWRCDLPYILELPELKYLRKLELESNSQTIMEVKGISGLSRLEELTILGSCTIWDDDNEATSIFRKLSQLTKLKSLFIELAFCNHPCPGEDLANNLEEFHIFVGEMDLVAYRSGLRDSSKSIELKNGELEDGWMTVVEKAEKVGLSSVRGFADGFSNRRNMRTGAFADLKVLGMADCHDMKHVASWDGRNEQLSSSFSNLTTVYITDCRGLKYLFSAAVAKCLHQLQELHVQYCSEIEEIIRDEGGRTDERQIISFPKLKELYLKELPKLTSFSKDKVRFPNMEKMTMYSLGSYLSYLSIQEIELGREDSPPKLNTLKIYLNHQKVAELPSQWLFQLENVEILELRWFSWSGDTMFNGTPTFGRLRDVEIERCEDTSLLRCSSLASLQQLETLKVSKCPLLEEILWGDEPRGSTDNTTISLPRLQNLRLFDLPMLKRCGIFACKMPAIEYVSVAACGFPTLFTSSAFTSLSRLSHLYVGDCPLLKNIVEDEMHDERTGKSISLSCLADITLDSLSSLESFSSSSIYSLNMPAVQEVTVDNCPLMHTFSLSEVIVPLLYFKSSFHRYPGIRTSDLNKSVREGYCIEEECKASDGE